MMNNQMNDMIELLNEDASIEDCIAKINELINKVNTQRKGNGRRDYGPKSETDMTELMAWRIRFGDLTSAKVKDIAEDNGLSRGQVYSVRGNYTFNHVIKDSYDLDDVGAHLAGVTKEEFIAARKEQA